METTRNPWQLNTGRSIANLAKFRSNQTLRTNRREVGDVGVLGPEIENSDRYLHFGLIIYSENLQIWYPNRKAVWKVKLQTVCRVWNRIWRFFENIIKPKCRSRSEFSISGPKPPKSPTSRRFVHKVRLDRFFARFAIEHPVKCQCVHPKMGRERSPWFSYRFSILFKSSTSWTTYQMWDFQASIVA